MSGTYVTYPLHPDYDVIWSNNSGSMYLCTGTMTNFAEARALRETKVLPEKGKRFYLKCPHCGRKFLFVEKNLTEPLLDLSCTCGSSLEILEE